MASTTNHGPSLPILRQRTCSPHHGRLLVRQQRVSSKQRSNGVCSAKLAVAARWQRRQSNGGSGTAAWRQRTAWCSRRQQSGGGGGNTVAVVAVQCWHWQRSGSICRSSTAAARQKQELQRQHLHAAEVLAAQGRQCQRSGGNDGGGGSLAVVSSGEVG